MKRIFTRKLMSVSALSLVMLSAPAIVTQVSSELIDVEVNFGAAAHAQAPECANIKKRKPRRLPAIGPKLFKKMEPARLLISPEENKKTGVTPKPKFKEGLAKMLKLINKCDGCNKYELSQMYNLAAYASYSLNDTNGAIKYYTKVYEQSPDLPRSLEQQSLYTVAQLLMTQEKYKQSLDTFKKWEKTCPKATRINEDYFSMLSQIYYQMGDKKQSMTYITKAITTREAKPAPKNVPKEGWYKLQLALHVEKENYKAAVKVMEKIVTHYSKQSNWSQLAGLYGLTNQEKKQRGILDALNVMGLLTKKADARNFGYALLGEEAPYLASKVFKKALKDGILERDSKNLDVYASSLRQAQETKTAIVIMEEAAKKSDKGQLYANLSAIYLDGDKFSKAIEAGNKALKKKGLKSEGEVHMYIGQAQMGSENYKSAIASFRKAQSDKRFKRYVPELIKYCERELKRAAQLQRSMREVGDA